jgi:catechol 2,3-dioxygenase-like lactoylglutathione lyase family enzyme
MPPVLNQVNLVVGDMAASAAFYRRLGVELPLEPQVHLEATFADGLSLELDDGESAQWWHATWRAAPGPRLVLTFRVESRDEVDDLYADLTGAGHEGRQPPFDAFFGSRYAIVADPDGNDVGLMSPRDPARSERGWPPSAHPPAP